MLPGRRKETVETDNETLYCRTYLKTKYIETMVDGNLTYTLRNAARWILVCMCTGTRWHRRCIQLHSDRADLRIRQCSPCILHHWKAKHTFLKLFCHAGGKLGIRKLLLPPPSTKPCDQPHSLSASSNWSCKISSMFWGWPHKNLNPLQLTTQKFLYSSEVKGT